MVQSNKLLIYGAGNNGKKLYSILIENGYNVDGFMVSDDHYYDKDCCGKRIYRQSEISKEDNIILALVDNEKIMEHLKNDGYSIVINVGVLC